MSVEVSLKKEIGIHDLALQAGRKRQSPRTGFVHLFHGEQTVSDTIPLLENFAFALALCLQRKSDTILEAKDLLLRLFAFQTEEGNFPTYLHDYPRAYDGCMGLKIAPYLIRLKKEYGTVLGAECKEKIGKALNKIIAFGTGRVYSPLWAHRYQAIQFNELPQLDSTSFTPACWWDYWVSLQLTETPQCNFFHPTLLCYVGPMFGEKQKEFEPLPQLIEWAAAGSVGLFSPRLLADHPTQILLSAIDHVELAPIGETEKFHLMAAEDPKADSVLRILWNGNRLHSLVMPNGPFTTETANGTEFTFTFPQDENVPCELAFYFDYSEETELFINGEKGSVFYFGETLELRSKGLVLSFVFEGEGGEFCGHLLRSNRPSQIGATGTNQYAAYDWKVALRTLRRAPNCKIHLSLSLASIEW